MSRKVAPNVAEKLKQLPKSPGCYIYRDEEGEVLYVGKAINLRNRVRSYFQASTQHGARIERMVFRVRDLEWIVVDSELEALVLECNLIKKHRPPYNVRLRDDKSYPYIVITNEKFPRVLFTRNPKKDKSKYFGPYTSAWAVRETIDLLHKVFPLIPCGKSWNGQPEQKPCLYHHIGQCMAPCAGLADLAEYRNVIGDVTACLSGRESTLLDSMKSAMAKAAEDLDFERAASLRDRIQSMGEHVRRDQRPVDPRRAVLVGLVADRDQHRRRILPGRRAPCAADGPGGSPAARAEAQAPAPAFTASRTMSPTSSHL